MNNKKIVGNCGLCYDDDDKINDQKLLFSLLFFGLVTQCSGTHFRGKPCQMHIILIYLFDNKRRIIDNCKVKSTLLIMSH